MEHDENTGQAVSAAEMLARLRAADERTVFAALARVRPGTLTSAGELLAFYRAMLDEVAG